MTSLLVSFMVGRVMRRRGAVHPVLGALLAWGVITTPQVTVAFTALVVARLRWRRARRTTTEARAADADELLLADLTTLALAAGHTVRSALGAAMPHLHPLLRAELQELLATMDRVGTGPALLGVGGRLGELGRVTAAASASGAPIGPALAAHADRLRHARHEARIARARRLPVRLLIPLALLILPGFVVLAVGPALLQALARLGPLP